MPKKLVLWLINFRVYALTVVDILPLADVIGSPRFYFWHIKRLHRRLLFSCGPGMVEALVSKTMAWEKERGTELLYDGVSYFAQVLCHDYLVSLIYLLQMITCFCCIIFC